MTKKFFKVIFLLFACYIAYLSLTPTDNTLMSMKHVDKIIHLLAYGLFAIIGYFSTSSYKKFIFICLCIFVFGLLMELGQSYVPGRMMSLLDLAANTCGIILGAVVIWQLFPKSVIKTAHPS